MMKESYDKALKKRKELVIRIQLPEEDAKDEASDSENEGAEKTMMGGTSKLK